MALRIYTVIIDAQDPKRLAEFWSQALGYRIAYEEGADVAIEKPNDDRVPAILFQVVPERKVVKNRLHFDLAPDDQKAEVERLQKLGAKEVDIGQRDVTWVVMADPEGNEFCVLTAR
ncbi:MAG: VOC family protein [Chloroflexi bacterium]|nr:MAG: VOC family protein [Chloroflexota bacterium]